MTQTDIERRFFERVERIKRGEIQPEEAFAVESDWVMEVGERRFLLHPGLKRWMWYDPLHDEWYDAGLAPGEGEIVVEGKRAWARRKAGAARPEQQPRAGAAAAFEVAPPAESAARQFCGQCGSRLEAGARFCGACGEPVR